MPVTSSKTRSERAKVRQAGHGAPPTRVARAGYSIAQADAAGLWTECTKARSGRAANDDSGKIHCKARRRAGVANCFAVALQSRNCQFKGKRAWRESLLRAEPEKEVALDPERSNHGRSTMEDEEVPEVREGARRKEAPISWR